MIQNLSSFNYHGSICLPMSVYTITLRAHVSQKWILEEKAKLKNYKMSQFWAQCASGSIRCATFNVLLDGMLVFAFRLECSESVVGKTIDSKRLFHGKRIIFRSMQMSDSSDQWWMAKTLLFTCAHKQEAHHANLQLRQIHDEIFELTTMAAEFHRNYDEE